MKQARRPTITLHRSRPTTNNREDETMDSYRNQIIAMLDTITDAKIMRGLYEITKLVMMHAADGNKMHRLCEIIRACLTIR